LSTLTKVLIVLQVVVALVLCGLVVSYVATADNYKQLYETESSKARGAIQEKNNAQDEFEKFKADKDKEFAQLTKEMGELNDAKSRLENDLKYQSEQGNSLPTNSQPRMLPFKRPTTWPNNKVSSMPRPRNNWMLSEMNK